MARSSLVYVMVLALFFGFVAAQSPSHAPGHSPTIPPENAPISHAPSVHPPAHAPSVHPPAHAPSPVKTPKPAPSPVVHSITPSVAPTPASVSAAVFNRFSTAGSIAVGVFAAVLVI